MPPRWLAASGLVGGAAMAFSLPVQSVIAGSLLLLFGAATLILRRWLVRRGRQG